MTTKNQIAALNDAMRAAGPGQGRWVITTGVLLETNAFRARAIQSVIAFDDFTSDNDPHGEHDFGALDISGTRVFWKIDYYDLSLEFGSPDPSDPAVTCRVLTIMLASEY